jgi:hypothetical protein
MIKKNIQCLLYASKEIGLKIYVNKTQYMVLYRDQDVGRSHYTKTENSSFGSA